MTAREMWAQVKLLLAKTPRQRSQELDEPSGYEPGLRHRHNGSHVLCRDDAVVELASGPTAACLVDGPAQTVRLQGSAIQLTGETVQLAAAPGGLYFGWQRFNPYWFSRPDPTQFDPLEIIRKSPLTLTNPLDLTSPLMILTAEGALDPTLIAEGVIPRPIASLFTPIPLFGPNEQLLILAENLGEMLRSLGEHAAELE